MKNLLIAQSGGPTAAINASLTGVLREAFLSEKIGEVYGGVHGIQGMLEGKVISLSERFKDNEDALNRLYFTPDMYLRTCRYKMKSLSEDETDYKAMAQLFKKYDIGYFLYTGGNDSMNTVAALSGYVKAQGLDVNVVGVPKTVDNDLVGIDHTPGFGSAAKYVAATVREIMLDTCLYPFDNVAVVEIMGRDAGWLTAAASLSPIEDWDVQPLIWLPEMPFEKERFMNMVEKRLKKDGFCVAAVSEGIRYEDGSYVSAGEAKSDTFGHPLLSGTGRVLTDMIKNRTGAKVRSIELATAQRSAGHFSSDTDLGEAFELGRRACRYVISGMTGIMSTLERISDEPYKVEYKTADVTQIADKVKNVPEDWIDKENLSVTHEMIKYLKPLITGEPSITFKDGLPDYIVMN